MRQGRNMYHPDQKRYNNYNERMSGYPGRNAYGNYNDRFNNYYEDEAYEDFDMEEDRNYGPMGRQFDDYDQYDYDDQFDNYSDRRSQQVNYGVNNANSSDRDRRSGFGGRSQARRSQNLQQQEDQGDWQTPYQGYHNRWENTRTGRYNMHDDRDNEYRNRDRDSYGYGQGWQGRRGSPQRNDRQYQGSDMRQQRGYGGYENQDFRRNQYGNNASRRRYSDSYSSYR